MNVVQVTHGRVNPDGDNGITRTVYNINKYLNNDISNTIISFDDRVTAKTVHERECGLKVELFPRNKLFIGQELKTEVKETKNTIFHFHLMWLQDKNCFAKEIIKNNHNYIITTHAAYTPDRIDSLKKKIALKTTEFEYLKNARAIHALCYEEKFILRELGLKNEIFVIPNGISDTELNLIDKSKELLSPYDDHYFNLVWVGRLRPDKNLIGMVESISLLPDSIKSLIKLNIVGEGNKEYLNRIQKLIVLLDLSDNITFHGSKFGVEKYNYIIKSDVYLQPSFSEGISFSILDALACGKPSIISRQCNMNYYSKHKAFEVVEPFSEDIANKIQELYEDSELREKLSRNALDLVEKEFHWKSLIHKYKLQYNKLFNV